MTDQQPPADEPRPNPSGQPGPYGPSPTQGQPSQGRPGPYPQQGQPGQQGQQGPYGPPQQQGPYGQPGQYGPQGQYGQQGPYGQPPQGQQPYGGPGGGYGPPPGWTPHGSSGGGNGGSGKKLALILGIGAVLLALLAGGIYVVVTGDDDNTATASERSADSGAEDSDEPDANTDEPEQSEEPEAPEEPAGEGAPMSAAAFENLRTSLESADWACFDSLDEPTVMKRCNYTRLVGGDTLSGTLSAHFDGTDEVGRVMLHTVFLGKRQQGATKLARAAAKMVGDDLLDGAGVDLVDTMTERSETYEVEGMRVYAGVGRLDLSQPDFRYESVKGPALPSTKQAAKGLKRAGLSCRTRKDYDLYLCESDAGDDIDRSAYTGTKNLTSWTADVHSFESGVSKKDVVDELTEMLADTGLTTEEGLAFIRAHADEGGEGDFGGYHLRVRPTQDLDYASAAVTVSRILG